MPRNSTPSVLRSAATRPAPKTTERVVFYRRASTDETNQPYSLQGQLTKLTAYVESQDDLKVVGDYSEYASAKDIEGRPEFLRLLEDAVAGKFDKVVVHKIDRWSRSLADLIATVKFLNDRGIGFVSATEAIDTNTVVGRMVLQILGSFAEFERGIIEERVNKGIRDKVATGIPLANVAFGLLKDQDGVVIQDPDTFWVVERIFRLYTEEKLGMRAIADRLNTDSAPRPGTRPWSVDAVARVLRNRTYVGDIPFKGEWLPGLHEALLPVEVFDAAQSTATRRKNNPLERSTATEHILTGTITCGHCGAAYVGTSGTSKSKTRVRYYTCVTSRRYGKKTCAAPSVPAKDLEDLVMESLLAAFSDTTLFATAVENILAAAADNKAPLEAERASLLTTVAHKERLLAKYQDDYESGDLSAKLYTARTTELQTELDTANNRLGVVEAELEAVGHPVPTDQDRQRILSHLEHGLREGSAPLRKGLLGTVIEKLEVHALDDIRPTYRMLLEVPENVPGIPEEESSDGETAMLGEVFSQSRLGWS